MDHNEEFELAIASFSADIQQLARETRTLVYNVLPQLVEVVWVRQKNVGFGTGIKKKTEHFCWLMPATGHVTLGFNYGAELPDPNHILEGTGKLFRHIKIRRSEDLSDPDMITLLKYATTYRVPPVK
ncbi:DUF1801 domain-containing protein [Flavobacteriaceae bacterium F89]|uniref:DUF1801 domain-containing protein n=1 Tax=Cerina litoralis TaxID=2874477 RepID=A0AAE3ET36_9FLAO|nr:DUF1801 domain-containing protein [Cerina litoralis]MCG2459970.1 DUF1801 domain-containing protein [Cerina litoralis]